MPGASEILKQVAERDLTVRMVTERCGDFCDMAQALNRAVGNLDEGPATISVAAGEVSLAAGQMGSSSLTLSQGASERAIAIERITSTLAAAEESAAAAEQLECRAREVKELIETFHVDGAGSRWDSAHDDPGSLSLLGPAISPTDQPVHRA